MPPLQSTHMVLLAEEDPPECLDGKTGTAPNYATDLVYFEHKSFLESSLCTILDLYPPGLQFKAEERAKNGYGSLVMPSMEFVDSQEIFRCCSSGMLNNCSVHFRRATRANLLKNTNLVMTLTVLRNIQKFTKPFSRKLSLLTGLWHGWPSTIPLKCCRPFPLPPRPCLQWKTHTPPTLSTALPSSCWLSAPWILLLNVLHSLTTFPISLPLGKAHNPSLSLTVYEKSVQSTGRLTFRLFIYVCLIYPAVSVFLFQFLHNASLTPWEIYSIHRDALSLPSSSRDVPFPRKS